MEASTNRSPVQPQFIWSELVSHCALTDCPACLAPCAKGVDEVFKRMIVEIQKARGEPVRGDGGCLIL